MTITISPMVSSDERSSFWTDMDALVTRFQHGNEHAFERLVESLSPRISAYASRFAHDRDEHDDLVQETVIQLYAALRGFRGDSAVSTFIYAVMHRTCLSQARKVRRYFARFARFSDFESDSEWLSSGRPADAMDAEEELLRRERGLHLDKYLRALPEDQRAAFILAELHELSYEQIAEVCNVPIGTVRSRINRAKQKLQQQICTRPELFGRSGNEGDRRRMPGDAGRGASE
ncbi:MAG: RNA polymerase sigma factor [Armatimonadota bacterium]